MPGDHQVAARRRRPHPYVVAERLMNWADQARRAGRHERSDDLLMTAYRAYDMPWDGFSEE
jgi:hypothetical protein